MAWTHQTAGTEVTGNNGTSLAPTAPTRAVSDLLVLVVSNFGGTNSRVPSVTSDWTPPDAGNGYWLNGTTHLGVWWRIATDTSADNATVTYTGTGVANDTQLARIYCFRPSTSGYVPAIRVYGTESTNASADDVGPITAIDPEAGDLLLCIAAKANDWNGTATISGETDTWTLSAQTESTTGSDAGNALLYNLSANGAATTTVLVVDNGGTASAAVGLGVLIAFRENPAPQTVTDTLTLADTRGGTLDLPETTDDLAFGDVAGLLFAEEVDESLTFADAIAAHPAAQVTEALAFAETVDDDLGAGDTDLEESVGDTLAFADQRGGTLDLPETVESFAFGDTVDDDHLDHDLDDSAADVLALADAVAAHPAGTVTDALTLADTVAAHVAAPVTDAVAFGETLDDDLQSDDVRSVESTLVLTEQRGYTLDFPPTQDTLAFSDTAIAGSEERVVDALVFGDTVEPELDEATASNRLVQDALAFAPTLGGSLTIPQSTDALAFADAATGTVDVPGGVAEEREVDEAFVVADTGTVTMSFPALDQALVLTDTVRPAFFVMVSDAVAFAEPVGTPTPNVTPAFSATRQAADTLTLADTVQGAVTLTVTDALTFAEPTVVGEPDGPDSAERGMVDALAFADAVVVDLAPLVTDAVAFAEPTVVGEPVGPTSADRSMAEALAFADTVAVHVTAPVADTLTYADVNALILAAVETVTEQLTLTESVVGEPEGINEAERTQVDAMAVADTVSAPIDLTVSDTLDFGDLSLTGASDILETPTDALVFGDAVTGAVAVAEVVVDVFAFADVRGVALELALADPFFIIDSRAADADDVLTTVPSGRTRAPGKGGTKAGGRGGTYSGGRGPTGSQGGQ
jgi:hypothetical protein